MVFIQELCDDSVSRMVANHAQDGCQLMCMVQGEDEEKELNPDAHVEHFVEVTVPRYTSYQFKLHFRMKPEVFEVS